MSRNDYLVMFFLNYKLFNEKYLKQISPPHYKIYCYDLQFKIYIYIVKTSNAFIFEKVETC